jgi:hypothetical protein
MNEVVKKQGCLASRVHIGMKTIIEGTRMITKTLFVIVSEFKGHATINKNSSTFHIILKSGIKWGDVMENMVITYNCFS